MTGEAIPNLIMQITEELRRRGVLVTCRPGEWCVTARHGREQDAYITDDIEIALAYGRSLAEFLAQAAAEPAPTPVPSGARRTARQPRTAKAARRAFFRAHRRRLRGRALSPKPQEQ